MANRRNSALENATRKLASLRSRIKRKPGDKPVAEWWAEYKAEEKALEDAKYRRCIGR